VSDDEADAELDAIEAETPGLKERVDALLGIDRSVIPSDKEERLN